MPRDLFGDVVKPSIKVGSRKWYTVPVSLGSHLAVVALLVLIPILAPDLLPLPDSTTVYTITDLKIPDPPPPPRRLQPGPVDPPPNPNAAPIAMPDGVKPEVLIEPGFENDTGVDIVIGEPGRDVIVAPPATPPPSNVPLRVGGMIKPPVKIKEAPLVYPPLAIAAHKAGMVIIEATIGTDGRVMNARILKSEPLLDQAALEAVKTWEYTPTLLNGIPVAVIMTVVVQFQLQR